MGRRGRSSYARIPPCSALLERKVLSWHHLPVLAESESEAAVARGRPGDVAGHVRAASSAAGSSRRRLRPHWRHPPGCPRRAPPSRTPQRTRSTRTSPLRVSLMSCTISPLSTSATGSCSKRERSASRRSAAGRLRGSAGPGEGHSRAVDRHCGTGHLRGRLDHPRTHTGPHRPCPGARLSCSATHRRPG